MLEPGNDPPILNNENRRPLITDRTAVKMAVASGFHIDEVLWMLDLAEPAPSAR